MSQCDWEHCNKEAEYRAPRHAVMPESYGQERVSTDYYWFCLEHIREYNASWDFFKDMDSDAIDAFRKDAVTGHRPTSGMYGNADKVLLDATHQFLKDHANDQDILSVLNKEEQQALQLLELSLPVTQKEIKQRYKILAKQYHPDINKDSGAEERFTQIHHAYLCLKHSTHFEEDHA